MYEGEHCLQSVFHVLPNVYDQFLLFLQSYRQALLIVQQYGRLLLQDALGPHLLQKYLLNHNRDIPIFQDLGLRYQLHLHYPRHQRFHTYYLPKMLTNIFFQY